MKLFISGQVDGFPADYVDRKFYQSETYIRYMGHIGINPTKIVTWSFDKAEARKIRLTVLMQCDGIFLQEDWQDCEQSVTEKQVAESLGMVILYQKDINDYARKKEEERVNAA